MTPTLMSRLREATQAEHRAIESTAFASQLVGGTLSRAAYVAQLAAYHVVYRALERRVAEGPPTCLSEVWQDDMARTSLLQADLAQLEDSAAGANLPRECTVAITELVTLVDWATGPQLLGFLYVLEGSALGNIVLLPRLHDALGPDVPDAYYRGRGRETRAHFRAFGERMNDALTEEPKQLEAIEAARAFFASMRELFVALGAGTERRSLAAAGGFAATPIAP